MIRVGRCTYDKSGKRTDPTYPNFTPIVVLMNSHSKWGTLGPYDLKDENGVIFENYYQSSKCYANIPSTVQRYSRWNPQIIWSYPAEIHCQDGKILPQYWHWRKKLRENKYAVRYPVGYNHRGACLFAIADDNLEEKLDYVTARKKIYLSKYVELVTQQPKFDELKNRLKSGENLLIIEVDGPHQESLAYYRNNYAVNNDFIVNSTILANEENLTIMLNDTKHAFGHGYCLAAALLSIDL